MNPATFVACGLITLVVMSAQAAPVDNSGHLREKKDDLARMVLVNAIYFKGEWKDQFDKKDTSDAEFHRTGAETVHVPMMSRKGKYNVVTNKELGYRMLELPYKGDRIIMQILLPTEKDGLAQVEAKINMDPETNRAWRNDFSPQTLNVYLPKFKMESSIDLSGSTGSRAVVQKAFVEVDEEGTVAAAATAAQMRTRLLSRTTNPIGFVADHPFLFFIRDTQTGMLLFQGRVADPSVSK